MVTRNTASHKSQKQPRQKTRQNRQPDPSALPHALKLLHAVCCLAGPLDLVEDIRRNNNGAQLRRAIRKQDTAALYDRLMNDLSYQGIADRVAYSYMQAHGRVTWEQIEKALATNPSCPKLSRYWAFNGCRYDKTSHTCSEPEHIDRCPLPRHDLRNGHLNQAAYSLFLFIRDLADNNLIAWIDRQLSSILDQNTASQLPSLAQALLDPLRQVYGVSDKVLSAALSILLLAAPKHWTRWHDVGANLIAIDTLVHNFLHRTGILTRFHSEHVYGAGCYGANGCADIIRQVAQFIDARIFNLSFPKTFPRFVQLAIWRYCAQGRLDICNGNRLDDRQPCNNDHCQLFNICDRVGLQDKSKDDWRSHHGSRRA